MWMSLCRRSFSFRCGRKRRGWASHQRLLCAVSSEMYWHGVSPASLRTGESSDSSWRRHVRKRKKGRSLVIECPVWFGCVWERDRWVARCTVLRLPLPLSLLYVSSSISLSMCLISSYPPMYLSIYPRVYSLFIFFICLSLIEPSAKFGGEPIPSFFHLMWEGPALASGLQSRNECSCMDSSQPSNLRETERERFSFIFFSTLSLCIW